MARCVGPSCTNYRRELGPGDIQEIKGRRVCAECWTPVEDEQSNQLAPPAANPSEGDVSAAGASSPGTSAERIWADQMSAVGSSAAVPPNSSAADWQSGQPMERNDTLPEERFHSFDNHDPQNPPPPIQGVTGTGMFDDSVDDSFAMVSASVSFPTLVICQGGKARGVPLEVRGDIFLIGRSSNSSFEPLDLDFAPFTDGSRVSRQHARIIQQGGRYYVEDLHSRRGTWLNDERVLPAAAQPLSHGDWINIAEVAEIQFLQVGGV